MTDFSRAELLRRQEALREGLRRAGLEAAFFTTEPEMRYFTGFRTPFWLSPTRPWYLIVSTDGPAKAIIPTIGEDLMQKATVDEIVTFASPAREDESIAILRRLLSGYSKIGMPMGPESMLRMPFASFQALGRDFDDISSLVQTVRFQKSAEELAYIREITAIGSRAFEDVPKLLQRSESLEVLFRAFRQSLLGHGADDVPYLVGAAENGGYADVISSPKTAPFAKSDIVMLDTGATKAGYYCDFDRNWALGAADDDAKNAYETLWQATETAIKRVEIGMKMNTLFEIIQNALGTRSNIGRYGHGLGIELTETPSIAAHDETVICDGAVLTIEPSLEYGPRKMMVHEENILITAQGAELLTKRAAPELPILEWER